MVLLMVLLTVVKTPERMLSRRRMSMLVLFDRWVA